MSPVLGALGVGVRGFGFTSAANAVVNPAFELISTTDVSSGVSSVTFSSLNTTAIDYKHLQIRLTGRSSRAADGDGFGVRFNGDTGGNYTRHYLYSNGSSYESASLPSVTYAGAITVAANTSAANTFSSGQVDILDFSNPNKNTSTQIYSGTPAVTFAIERDTGMWMNVAAVTSVTVYCMNGNIVSGSRLSLYGIRG